MPDSVLLPARVPARTLFVYFSAIAYVAICLAFTVFAARALHARVPGISTFSRLMVPLAYYLLILAVVDLLLAFVFAFIFHGHIFAMIRFIAAGLFFVLPATLIIFWLTVWISRPSQLSPAATAAISLGLLLLTVMLLGTYIYAHSVEPHRLGTTFYRIQLPKLAALDSPLRIVLLADIQVERVTKFEKSVLEKTLELKPDLILLAGDYLQCPDQPSYHSAAQDLQALLRELDFTAPLGVFAVPGHAESRNGHDCFDGTKVQWLIDQTATIQLDQVSICLLGLSLKAGGGYIEQPPQLLGKLDSANFNIVLSHMPDFVLDLPADHTIDLCLAGHTHGGQICLPFIGALTTACRIPRSLAHGLHRINGTSVCISRGVGTERGWAPPLRFLCPPEIVVLDLVP